MNNEIKEILDGFKEILDNPTTTDECYDGRIIEIDRSYDLDLDEIKLLLDYITNLQQAIKDTKDTADDMLFELKQENERLKENNQAMQEEMAKVWQENERLKEELFKSVNNTNKSIELTEDYKSRCEKAIEYIKEMLYPIGSCVNGSDLPYESIESLLNILQNGSDSQ